MSRRNVEIIGLPCFDITVRLTRRHTTKVPGAGTIISKLKTPDRGLNNFPKVSG
jgi:hypothetical protein